MRVLAMYREGGFRDDNGCAQGGGAMSNLLVRRLPILGCLATNPPVHRFKLRVATRHL